jgi:hypothetical protein
VKRSLQVGGEPIAICFSLDRDQLLIDEATQVLLEKRELGWKLEIHPLLQTPVESIGLAVNDISKGHVLLAVETLQF